MVATNITFWQMYPTSGLAPLVCTVDGFLFRNGIEENQPDSEMMDYETVQLQVQASNGQWGRVTDFVTAYDSVRGYHGHVFGTYTINNPGTFNFRLHYDGNTAKNLSGCEKRNG
jgi:hypothetical protein